MRPNSISIKNVYNSFEYTRSLLIEEIESFSKSIKKQMDNVDAVKKAARSVPDARHGINEWLSNTVEPKLIFAQEQAEKLKGELLIIPRLESKLRYELEQNIEDSPLEKSTIFSLNNGFGFIKYPPNNLYFHHSNLIGIDFNDLKIFDKVQFRITKNDKNEDVAVNVSLSE